MDINALKTFIQVAESGSFSKAAIDLHITQPAVSKRIAMLESQFGQRLIDRIGRKIALTQAGKTLLPHARTTIIQFEDTRRSLDNLSGEVTGTFNLGISHHLGLHRLPPILKAFARQYPNVTLDIHFLDSEVAYEGVLHGSIELGLITLTQDVSDKVNALPVWNDPLKFVVSADHPLATKPAINLLDVSRHNAILPQIETFTGALVKKLFDERSLPLNASSSTNYLETIKKMVSIGLGWSVLPETLVDNQLVELKIEGVYLERQLGAIHHTERTLSNAANALLVKLKQLKTE